MSKLDERFLAAFMQPSWRAAFSWCGERLGVKPASLKNLRDEFDPIHSNSRRGWADRPMRPGRLDVVSNFSNITEQELIEIVRGILFSDPTVEAEVVQPLAGSQQRIANVAQRLRTGRLAEEYFLEHSADICEVDSTDILDERELARGYDFAVRESSSVCIEIKGLTTRRGDIIFTELEWRVARERRGNYWLVVVGCLATEPTAKLFTDPQGVLQANEVVEQVRRVSWRSRVSV